MGLVSRRRVGLAVVLFAVVTVGVVAGLFSLNQPVNSSPARDYAIENGIPSDLADIMSHYMDKDGEMDQYERLIVDNISSLGHYLDSPMVHSTVESMLSDGVTYSDVQRASDVDGDYITNDLEVNVHNTDPTKADTLGLGLPDFHAVYVYGVDPNDPVAVKEFLAKIPNVKANNFSADDGGYWKTFDQIAQLSLSDPLIKTIDKQIVWDGNGCGIIYVGGEPINKGIGENSDTDTVSMPSHFLTNGRKGHCMPTNLASFTILKAMGYKCIDLGGKTSVNAEIGHDWSEVLVDGKLYVESNGGLYPRQGFYEQNGWITEEGYNPEWFR